MATPTCPHCGSSAVHFNTYREDAAIDGDYRAEWKCLNCGTAFQPKLPDEKG